VLGPIGVPFRLEGYRRRPLLIGGGVGLPPMVYLAEHLRRVGGTMPLVVLGSEVPFPFTLRPSTIMVPGLPPHVIATMPLLEDWGIACRLASQEGYPGCFDGFVTELAAGWIEALGPETRNEIEIFACGPTPMLKAVQALAAHERQVSAFYGDAADTWAVLDATGAWPADVGTAMLSVADLAAWVTDQARAVAAPVKG
jgi:dihydroorotate dehydrogenase electron transfer subunit